MSVVMTNSTNPLNLQSKKIIVTGGSRGIGKAVVQNLVACGAKVAFTHTGSSPEAEVKMNEWLTALNAEQVKAFPLNLSNTASFKDALSAMTDFLDGLDGLVNNAGLTANQLMLRMKEDEFDRVMDVNVKGSYFFTKECLRPLLKSEAPSVVFLSSVAGEMGNAGQSTYSASKGAVMSLAKSLARELGSRNFRANVVAPGFIETDMTHELPEELKKNYLNQIPLGRFGAPLEVAHCIAFLLSDMSRYVTGHVLSVNGGLYI